jgi:hypothetical protein
LSRSAFPVMPVCSTCPFQDALFCLFCFSCHLLPVQFCLSFFVSSLLSFFPFFFLPLTFLHLPRLFVLC